MNPLVRLAGFGVNRRRRDDIPGVRLEVVPVAQSFSGQLVAGWPLEPEGAFRRFRGR